MTRPFDRIVDYFAAEPLRVSAWLRLPLLGLIMVLMSMADIEPWFPAVYWAVLAVYTASALAWFVIAVRGRVPPWAAAAATAIDILAVLTLCVASGPAAADLLPVLFLLPISIAFEGRPATTAMLGIAAATGYLAVWITYSKRDDTLGMPDEVYLHFGLFLWLAAATTALSLVLAHRTARVAALMEVRRRLVSESTWAAERHSRELAEHLHDGPLQTLLAARLELEVARDRNPDPALDMLHSALQETAAGLRSTVTALHPQVLAQLGLTPAVRELLRQFESRGDYTVDAELEDVGKPESQQLLYRAARELLANIHKHARATIVRVGLSRKGDRIILTIADDGTGFDPAIVERYVADGHIGLGSLLARFDAMGGSMDVRSEIGYGTQVTVTSPPEPVDS